MFKDKALFIPFILLHIGQWMYTMNMPLFVTNYLRERDSYVGYLASLCAGLEVPFMVILGILSAKFPTRTLLLLVHSLAAHFILALVYLKLLHDVSWSSFLSNFLSYTIRIRN